MNKNIKIGAGIALAGVLAITTGLFIKGRLADESSIKTDEYVSSQGLEDSSEDSAKLEEDTKEDGAKKEEDSKEETSTENKNANTSDSKKNENKNTNTQNNAAASKDKNDEVIANLGQPEDIPGKSNAIDAKTKENLINVVKTNDSEFIKQKENEYSSSLVFEVYAKYSDDSGQAAALKDYWGRDIEEHYRVLGYLGDSREEAYLQYLIGAKTGDIIAMPFQGGEEAYQIKDNKVVNTYSYCEGESYKWR